MINHQKKIYKFSNFKNSDLKDYKTFKRVIDDLRNFYELNDFAYNEIDAFLWGKGKEYFGGNKK